VAQTIPEAKAIIVTTPQEVSLADVRKSINFCKHINMEILGLIENMGPFNCPHCGEQVDLFKRMDAKNTAERLSAPFLGTIPFHQDLVKACDEGKPIMSTKDDSHFYRAFASITEKVVEKLRSP
jgi:Mrp family chromosome partitioning ATPase